MTVRGNAKETCSIYFNTIVSSLVGCNRIQGKFKKYLLGDGCLLIKDKFGKRKIGLPLKQQAKGKRPSALFLRYGIWKLYCYLAKRHIR